MLGLHDPASKLVFFNGTGLQELRFFNVLRSIDEDFNHYSCSERLVGHSTVRGVKNGNSINFMSPSTSEQTLSG